MARRSLGLKGGPSPFWRKLVTLGACAAFFCAQLLLAPCARAELRVKLRADRIDTNRTTGISNATGNVRLEVEGVVVTTDHLTFDQTQRIVSTDAPFTLVQKGADGKVQTITGTGLSYEMRSDKATVYGAKLTVPAQTPGQVVYITGKELVSYARKEFEVHDGTFTTCDYVFKEETPHYHVQSGWIKYVPDDYAMGTNVVAYVENHPVFWLPYFYIPLKRRESSVQTGRNSVEGLFIKTALAYRLNANNYGNLYLDGLEFKKPGGIGIDHVWNNSPNSITAFTLYGLPLPDMADYVPGTPTPGDPYQGAYAPTNPWIVNRLDPNNPSYFQDHYYRFRHQQRLLDTMTLDGWYEDRNIYDLTRVSPTFDLSTLAQNPQQPYRDDHTAWFLGLTDNRLGTTYGFSRNNREDYGFSHIRSTQDAVNFSGTYGGTNFTERTNRQQQSTLAPQYTLPPGVTTPTAEGGYLVTPPSTNTSFTNNLQINQTFTNALRGDSTTDHTRTEYPAQPLQERLTQTFDLTQDLGWGNAKGTMTRMFNLALPATGSVEDRNAAISGLGYVDKLPELSVSSNPLFEQYQPFTLSGVYGRYVEDQAYVPGALPTNPNPATRLEPVGRLKLLSELTSKPVDLGLGTQLNFGSTGYEQRYYTTGDSEFRLTGQAALTNQITPFFNTNVTYHRDYTPGQIGAASTPGQPNTPFNPFGLSLGQGFGYNASPFRQFESLSIAAQNTLTAAANAVYKDAFSWNNNLGYNYQIQRYTPYSTSLNFKPSPRVNLSLNSGYAFSQNVSYLQFGTGQWQDISGTLHVQSSDQGFGGVYGEDHLIPGWSFDTSLDYSINTGKWQALSNKITLETGTTWQTHWALVAEGQFNVTTQHYDLLDIGINKDLHDFILSVQYNERLQSYTLNLAMVAFPTNLINLSNKSFGGLGDPSQLGNQLGNQFGLTPGAIPSTP